MVARFVLGWAGRLLLYILAEYIGFALASVCLSFVCLSR